ncbi:hypothetical protein AVEN_200638-1 [Araneus ventricosus]|uniref:Uncharacterized protein n=1 Tax=Araneus ventricosus TaxID=182803 RepID=A0A4Y2I3H2_ARAVE|nr:hypothetical protein AVEN_200638-1 [Araneus ventricosus]
MLTSSFDATQRLFWDGRHKFETWSNNADDTWAGTPSSNFHATPAGGHLILDRRFNVHQYTADLQWNRVSNLEPMSPEAEAVPLGRVTANCS